MNRSLSREKKQAHRTTTSEVCVHQPGTTACMFEEIAIRNEEAKRTHAYQIDPELSRESSRANGSIFDEKASFNWPKQVPRSMPKMPRRITNCNGCGVQLQAA
eukprot:4321411-Karenia_brevis.AAC.1